MEFFQRREIFRNINESYTHTYIYIYLILSRVVFEKKKKTIILDARVEKKKNEIEFEHVYSLYKKCTLSSLYKSFINKTMFLYHVIK